MAQSLGQHHGLVLGRLAQEHDKFVAAVTAEQVGLPDPLLQDSPHLPHDFITLQVAQGVVDLLEVIDVQEKQRERGLIAAALLHLIVERLLEVAVIIQAGQGIPDGHAFHPVEEHQILDAGLPLENEDPEEFGFLRGEEARGARPPPPG